MVYDSIPSYLDPPPNRNQQQYQQQSHRQQQQREYGGIIITKADLESNQHLFQPQLPPRQEDGSFTSTVRPNSMVDRGRQAKLPPPEQALKCPRCDSTNTKFCYYNNYSLSQPRHFCKTCRRYCTRGGALRNVPVDGGCQQNKRVGKSSSSSTTTTTHITIGGSNKAGASNSSIVSNLADRGGSGSGCIISPPPIPFMNSLPDYGVFPAGSIGLNFNFAGIHAGMELNDWRHQQIQQFPSFTTRSHQQTTTGGLMYQLQEESDSGLISQRLNLPKQNLGMPRNGQNFAGNVADNSSSRGKIGWSSTDLNGFN